MSALIFNSKFGKRKLVLKPLAKKPEAVEDQVSIKTGYIGAINPSVLIGSTPGALAGAGGGGNEDKGEEDETFKDVAILRDQAIDLPEIESEKIVEVPFKEEDIKVINLKYPLI